jgi:hypothetical protein
MKKQMKAKKLELNLDAALEEVARKLRPTAKLDDDADYATPAGSCTGTQNPECKESP